MLILFGNLLIAVARWTALSNTRLEMFGDGRGEETLWSPARIFVRRAPVLIGVQAWRVKCAGTHGRGCIRFTLCVFRNASLQDRMDLLVSPQTTSSPLDARRRGQLFSLPVFSVIWMYISLLHNAYQSASTCHRCTSAFGSGASISDAMGGNSKVCEAKHRTAAAAAAPTPAELRTDMVATPDFTALQQQFRQDMTDVIQQLRVEVNETVTGRKDMLNSTNTALQKISAKQRRPSHTESVTFFQETSKAATTEDNFDSSCRTCTCGCKRGQTKEKHCLSALRAPTSLTTARLQMIVQMRSSDRLRRNSSNYCTERQQTNR